MNARSRRRTPVALERIPRADAADDDAIVDGLRDGALDALAAAFDRWHGRVRVLARRLLSDPASAEDVVQEVFASLAPRHAAAFAARSTSRRSSSRSR